MSAAEARRRMKAELQAQLDRLNAQEEEERQAQEARQRDLQIQREQLSSRTNTHRSHGHRTWEQQGYPLSQAGGSTSSYRPSRSDAISPTWPHSHQQQPQQQQQQARSEWSSDVNSNRNGHVYAQGSRQDHADRHGTSSSQHTDARTAFQPMPEPTPMFAASGPPMSGAPPWQRHTASSSTKAPVPDTYTSPLPDTTNGVPSMPNPLSASFINTPVPSKYQLHEYLVNKQKQPLGLGMGWSIEGFIFDVYDLFVAVIRLGGSATVTRRTWWPGLAGMLGIPSINTPHGLRASPEAARQLSSFYALHLGTLEKMWDETRPASGGLGEGLSLAGDRSEGSRIRQPVSATRGAVEDPLRSTSTRPSSTYPPPPPEHRESSSSTQHYGRSRPDGSAYPPQAPASRSQPAPPTSMPLHVNPTESAAAFPLQQPPQRKKPSSSAKARQPTGGSSNGVSTPGSRPSAGVSPVLNHPVPLRPNQPPPPAPEVSQQRTTIDPNFFAPQPRISPAVAPVPAPAPAASSSIAPPDSSQASSAKDFTFASLSNYHPPKFASFDHLVATNALTLPTPPPNVQLNFTGSEGEVYAKRCFELRGVVKKIQAKEPARQVSKEEMTFWQKLLAILRHNPTVVIPGSQPMSTENVPHVPLPPAPSQGIVPEAGSSNANGAGPAQAPKKKRGRPPRPSVDEHGNPIIPPPKRRKGRPSKADKAAEEAAALAAGQLSSVASASISNGIGPSSSGPIASSSQAPPGQPRHVNDSAPNGTVVTGESSQDAATALASLANHLEASQASTGADSGVEGEARPPKPPRKPYTIQRHPDGTPIRKAYTIRRHPDGTPIAERFRKTLNGSAGPSPMGSGSQAAPIDFTAGVGDAAPDTLAAYYDRDAIGEIDPDAQPIAGPSGSQPSLPVAQALAQIPSASGSGEKPPKTKNLKLSESMKLRWEKHRRERAFSMLSGQLAESAAANPAFGQAGPSTLRSIAPAVSTNGTSAGFGYNGLSIPGAAAKAAAKRWSGQGSQKNGKPKRITAKRWSLQHAALAAATDDDDLQPQPQSYRAATVSPAVSLTPRRVIALSDRPERDREGTPSRIMSTDSIRQRAGSLKPRSSLPMHLTPAPKRDWSPVQSQEPEFEPEYEHEQDVDLASEAGSQPVAKPNGNRKGKGKSLLINRAPRSSLPGNLGSRRGNGDMGPPLSTERPRMTRSDKGKGVDRGTGSSTPDTSARMILTRGEKSRGSATPELRRLTSRRSMPSMRSSSAAPRSSRLAMDLSARAPRASQPPSSQPSPRSRLVPEVEIVLTSRPSQSQSTPTRPPRPASAHVPAPARVQRPTTKIKPTFKSKPLAKVKAKPVPRKPKRKLRRHVRVVIPIRRRRRAQLIAAGYYDPFRDDDSDTEEVINRYGHSGLRPKVALPRGSQARTARPQEPDVVPLRFIALARGPNDGELQEPHRSALAEDTILKRLCEHECGWKGCDSVLASEWHLRRHIDLRRHAAQGVFRAGVYGEQTLYRCHWEDCEQPCFSSLADLEQHLTARHVSRNLSCPFPGCGLTYSTLSHLTRHALKHHDSPSDLPVPLVDLPEALPPPAMPDPPQPLPEEVRTDMLTTPVISGSIFRSFYRAEWCRLKVKNGSYAPAEPVLHIEHPPHILGRIDNSEDEDDISDAESVYTALGGGVVTEERLLDASLGRPKRRLVPVVNIRVTRRSKEGSAGDIVRDQAANDHDVEVISIDADEDIGEVDFDLQPLPISGPASESDLDPALDLGLDLGEANEFDDPIQGEEAFAPVLGPRPEDILFDLSDSSLHDGETNGGTGTQTPASEAEVWAELEDGEMNQAHTPAGMLGDYEMSEDGSEHDHGQVGTVQVGGEEDGVPDGVIDLGFTDAETVAMREEQVQSSHGDDAQGSGENSSEDDGGDVFEEMMDG